MEEFMERQKILIVEDDADISGLLVKIMEGAGYQVRQVFSGTEALFCMERELPDCALMGCAQRHIPITHKKRQTLVYLFLIFIN